MRNKILIEALTVTLIVILPLLILALSVLMALISAKLKVLKLEEFCKRNNAKEIICILTPPHLVFLDTEREIIKTVYSYEFCKSLWNLLQTLKTLSKKLRIKISYFNSFQDLDDELIQKLLKKRKKEV